MMLVGFVGGTGGASSFMRELAAGIQERGWRTQLVVPAWESTLAFAESAEELGVPVERTPWMNMERGYKRTVFDAMRFLRRYRAPVVHYHLSDDYVESAFLQAMDILRPPAAFASMHCPYSKSEDAAAVARWVRKAPRHFERVICVSQASQRRHLDHGLPESITTLIHNGVSVDRFGSGDAHTATDAIDGLPASARLIVCTARVEEQKQPLAAVAVFERVAHANPDVHLVMVGRGPLLEATRAAADATGVGDRIHLVGHQQNIPDWLAAAAVWLLPTLGEGFSLGVIEAMAAGCAIVSTRCPGNDEVLVEGENALTARVGDVEGMAAAVARLLSDPSLRGRLSASARETARRFSLAKAVDLHLDCYGLARARAGVASGSARVGSVEAQGHVA